MPRLSSCTFALAFAALLLAGRFVGIAGAAVMIGGIIFLHELGHFLAAKRMGIPQPKVSGMMRGDFTNLSERKLMDCLNRLGYDIEIKVRPASEPVGHLTISTA